MQHLLPHQLQQLENAGGPEAAPKVAVAGAGKTLALFHLPVAVAGAACPAEVAVVVTHELQATWRRQTWLLLLAIARLTANLWCHILISAATPMQKGGSPS